MRLAENSVTLAEKPVSFLVALSLVSASAKGIIADNSKRHTRAKEKKQMLVRPCLLDGLLLDGLICDGFGSSSLASKICILTPLSLDN